MPRLPIRPSTIAVDPKWRRLVRTAHGQRARQLPDAQGRCLGAALWFTDQARAEGIELELVVWNVVGDRDFADHWASALGDHIIDLTRVQVDGRGGVSFRLADYPANYLKPRRYPASLLLDAVGTDAMRGTWQLPLAALFRLRLQMLCHDATHLGASGLLCVQGLRRAAHVLASLTRFAVVMTARAALARLRHRRDRLLHSLAAEVARRPSPAGLTGQR